MPVKKESPGINPRVELQRFGTSSEKMVRGKPRGGSSPAQDDDGWKKKLDNIIVFLPAFSVLITFYGYRRLWYSRGARLTAASGGSNYLTEEWNNHRGATWSKLLDKHFPYNNSRGAAQAREITVVNVINVWSVSLNRRSHGRMPPMKIISLRIIIPEEDRSRWASWCCSFGGCAVATQWCERGGEGGGEGCNIMARWLDDRKRATE